MASRLGDQTARLQGRVTLNPIPHVDPVGTLIIPALIIFGPLIGFTMFSGVLIGWAKPTPVNPLRWRNKRVANFWVSIAGVICNFIIALVAGVIIRILFSFGIIVVGGRALVPANTDSLIAIGAVELLWGFFYLNVILGVFNLIPIPPLDGSKVLQSILPSSFDSAFEVLERFGYMLLILAMLTGVFGTVFGIFVPIFIRLLFLGASY